MTPTEEEVAEVGDDESLIRHLDPRYHWDFINNRPNVGAFRSQELSCDREMFRTAEIACGCRQGFGFARLAVNIPRGELSLIVRKDPIVPEPQLLIEPEPSLEYNPGHSLIEGATKKSQAKRMRDAVEVIYAPGDCR